MLAALFPESAPKPSDLGVAAQLRALADRIDLANRTPEPARPTCDCRQPPQVDDGRFILAERRQYPENVRKALEMAKDLEANLDECALRILDAEGAPGEPSKDQEGGSRQTKPHNNHKEGRQTGHPQAMR